MSNEPMGTYDQAQIAAIIELQFNKMRGLSYGDSLDSLGLEGFTFVDMGEFDRDIYRDTYPNNTGSMKAVTLRGPDGQLYVHFNGTGDGNWGYNSAAYQDGLPSDVQNWSLNYFNSMVEQHGRNGGVYVSGHSQGGNNAQFVTMRSAYGERIRQCISLDGPGFSNRFVEDTKNMYGQDYYDRQREKIYGYHGKNDFVSPLGQQDIIPGGHVRYLDYGDKDDFVNYHAIEGLFVYEPDPEHPGMLRLKTPPQLKGLYGDGTDCSDFRKMVVSIADRIKDLPQDQQERAAEIVMKFCEYYLGSEEENRIKGTITEEDLADFKELLIPLLIEAAEGDTELILSVLEEMGVAPDLVELAEAYLGEFNNLPPETRREALEFIAQYIEVKDGELSVKKWDAFVDIWEKIIHDPAGAWDIIQEYHLDDLLVEFLKQHPVATVVVVTAVTALVILFPELIPFLGKLVMFLDTVIHLIDLAKDVYEFAVKVINAIKETIEKVKVWLNKTFNRGLKYAQQNPWFRVDTDKLRGYAERLRKVNGRLLDLDSNMRSLYWQVGFLDLWDILQANLITSWSASLLAAQTYLNNTAERFEAAERTAQQTMGG